MSAIQEMPLEKDYGLGFNYSLWTAGTVVTLANVPWNSDYRDIVRFPDQTALDDYVLNNSGPVISINKLSYAKFGRPIRIDRPFNSVQNFNYIRAYNPMQPVTGDMSRAFYYFITDVVYVAPNTTEIYIQLDVWQTFGYGVSFGNCYIERGHIGIANERGFDNYGLDYLTTPEGLDLGNEYDIHKQYQLSVGSARFQQIQGITDYSIMVVSSTALDEDAGTVEAPKLTSAKGSEMENLPNGAEIYLFNSLGHFKLFMEAMADKPWVTQGIMSIQAVPRLDRYGVQTASTTIYDVPVNQVTAGVLKNVTTPMGSNWRDNINLGRYANLKKLLVYPYCVLEMTSYTGTPLMLKPECWNDPDASVVEVPHFAPPNARLAFYPFRYNTTGSIETSDINGVINDGGEFLNMVTGIMNFPSFSVVNNGYMQFLASNANSLAYQHSSADWSQQRALSGNATSYDQASAGINLSKDLSAQGINAATQSTALANQTAGFNAIRSGISAVGQMGNGPLGAISATSGMVNAGVSYAIDTNTNNQSLGIANSLAAGQNRSSTDTSAYMRDTNKSLADWSANGDYQNQIAGINARVQDAKLTQPTSAGQVGGDAFNLATYKWGVDVKVKMLQPAVLNSIGEYWLRYGYAVNRFGFMPASYMVMEKFTYWKLKETYITSSSCPETFKQVIRGIFEKGVTVWNNPTDIGYVNIADNAPLSGVSF